MFVDVLKRYLLIVWNFFFGQVSTESIKDGSSCSKDEPEKSADTVPSVGVDSDEGAIVIDDEEDIEEIYDDEEEQDEDEGEDEEVDDEVEVDEDEEKEVVVPKTPEDKIIKNDVPTKPSDPTKTIEEVKAAEVPKIKDNVEIKKPELPKVHDAELKDKSKSITESDETEKKDDVKVVKEESPKLKPEIPEKESSKVIPGEKDTSKLKPELDIKEKEPSKHVPKEVSSESKPEFEIIEREQPINVTPKEVSSDSKTEFEIIEREGPKVVSEKDSAKLKPVEPKENEVPKAVAEKEAPKSKGDDKPSPAKVAAHVKFEDDTKEEKDDGKPVVPSASGAEVKVPEKPVVEKGAADHDANSQFVVLEKGEAPAAHNVTVTGGDGPKKTDHSIDSFLLGEQTHSSRLHHHPESIQDQQLDYSDSGEELSDDDIEIDYEDDDDDEEVEEVKPLPPVARSVYKKND